MGDPASDGSGAYAPMCWIGVTEDETAPDPTRTALPGEITDGTLVRAQAAYAHTDGTASYTLTKIFVFDRDFHVRKIGVFNAPTAGTMGFETTVTVAAGSTGDTVQVTEVVTL